MQACYYNLEILTPLGLEKKSHPDVNLNANTILVYIKCFFFVFFYNCFVHFFMSFLIVRISFL